MRSSAIRDLLSDAHRPGMLALAGGLPASGSFDVEGIGQAFALSGADPSTLRLSFATLAPTQLSGAVERLSRAHRRLQGRAPARADPAARAARAGAAPPGRVHTP
ncbi:MAG: hypothetical protein EHM83_14545 [Burkholderiales bacterium]|nr:MAG: hypothetical protein EHM83_14545 [Burkholderiales bacterium]